jgi:DNA polymerase II small subunit
MQFVKEYLGKGYLFESSLIQTFNEALEKGVSEEDLSNLTSFMINLGPPKLVSRDFFINNLTKLLELPLNEATKIFLQGLEIKKPIIEIKKPAKDIKEVEILDDFEIKTKKIGVEDFVKYFRDRYIFLKEVLQERSIEGLCSIGKIPGQQRQLAIIGLVYDKKITKNKNMLLELEDLSGMVSVLVRQNSPELIEKANNIVLDEVVAIRGVGSSEIVFANDIISLDVVKEIKRTPEEIYVAFTADLHVGSSKFLETNFLKFIEWLNGNLGSEKQRELAKKIRYLFILGDNVDGVGVYPRQEPELLIKDVREQYRALAELLGKIRKDIIIIMCAGGKHDAVCQVEPQPKIPKDIVPELYNLENVILTRNPAMVRIAQSKDFSGLDILIYHGDSFDYYMDKVESLRLNNAKLKPDMIMHFLLKKRHLAPSHTSTTYYPFEKDLLIIRKVPDVFAAGHIHKSAVSRYKGILTVSCSCWQSKTAYQEKFGHEPDPCKIPILNLKTGKASIVDFS